MSQPTATRTSHDSRSDLAALGRVTGAAGVVTVVTVIGASLVDGYQNQSMTEQPRRSSRSSTRSTTGWAG
jgi:hypothetical protein